MRAVFWVFFVATLLFGVVWLLKDNIRQFLFPNTIWVKGYEEADIRRLRIDWTAEGTTDTLTIFNEGKQLKNDFGAEGYNTFILYYNNKLVTTFDQFKRSGVGAHKYYFMFWAVQDSVKVDLKIQGPDAPL